MNKVKKRYILVPQINIYKHSLEYKKLFQNSIIKYLSCPLNLTRRGHKRSGYNGYFILLKLYNYKLMEEKKRKFLISSKCLYI